MLDKGFTLPNYASTSLRERPTDMEKGKVDFREKFTNQIKDLIKREPHLVQSSSGNWKIFYA
jgi:hypothetical protein